MSTEGKKLYKIDFTNVVNSPIPGEENLKEQEVLQFYEKRDKSDKLLEYAYIQKGSDQIFYKNEDGDISYVSAKNINEFIFNIYNNIEIPGKKDSDIMKKSKNSKPFYEIKILGKKIPLAVYLLLDENSQKDAFNLMELEFKLNDKKDNDAKINMNYKVESGEDTTIKYLSLYPKNLKQERFANGLNSFKIKDFITKEEGINGIIDCLTQKALSKYGSGYVSNIMDISNRFIDGSTKQVLNEYGYNNELGKVFSKDMVDMISQRTPKSQYDLDNYRLRMSETVTSVAYKQLHQAIKKFKNTSHLSKSKIDMSNNYILDELIGAGILQYTKTLNPLEEAMLSLKVTKTGIGNVLKNQVNLNRRDTNASYFGIIGPTSTNEYGGIGVNQTLTNGAIIENRFGSLKKKKFNNDSNPFENLSPVESLSPFFEYDDTTRRVMGNQQTGQFVQLENPDVPLVQTGFEAYMPHLVSDRFSKKAKQDGIVQSATKDEIVIKYEDGKIDRINTKMVKARTKRGIFLGNEYNNLVQKGQKVKKGDLLSVSNSLKTGKLAIGKNLVVAEMGYLGMNYEDGWAVSDKLDQKYKNSVLQKIAIPYPVGSRLIDLKLEEGMETKAGDILFEYTTSENISNIEDDSEDSDDIMVGLEQRGNTNIYRSPGGKIKEVVIKINNNSIDNKIKALHKKLTEPIKSKIDDCTKKSDNADNKTQEYSDCIGHLENSESLVIGGHKINQVEIDGAIIEIYIEQENVIRNGSKFTLASSGGKGTVQYIMEHGKEPIAKDSGLVIDFVGTSLSIISRKNPSILLGLYLGKVIYFLNKSVDALVKQNKILAIKNLVLEIFTCLDKTKDNMIIDQLNEFFTNKNNDIIKYINSRDPLNNPAFPAIVPPFKNKLTIKDIQAAADILGISLNEKVIIPENGGTTSVNEVPVGIIPVHFLEHFPKAMSSTRGSLKTGKNWVTGQGRSGTSEGTGATKVGLFDLNSLISKQTNDLLYELHSLKSDASSAKKRMQRLITRNNEIPSQDDLELKDVDFTSKNLVDDYFKGAGLKFGF